MPTVASTSPTCCLVGRMPAQGGINHRVAFIERHVAPRNRRPLVAMASHPQPPRSISLGVEKDRYVLPVTLVIVRVLVICPDRIGHHFAWIRDNRGVVVERVEEPVLEGYQP